MARANACANVSIMFLACLRSFCFEETCQIPDHHYLEVQPTFNASKRHYALVSVYRIDNLYESRIKEMCNEYNVRLILCLFLNLKI